MQTIIQKISTVQRNVLERLGRRKKLTSQTLDFAIRDSILEELEKQMLLLSPSSVNSTNRILFGKEAESGNLTRYGSTKVQVSFTLYDVDSNASLGPMTYAGVALGDMDATPLSAYDMAEWQCLFDLIHNNQSIR